jgi:hypothetical protein
MKVKLTIVPDAWLSPAERRAIKTAFGDGFYYKYRYSEDPIDLIATAAQLVGYQVAREALGGKNLWKQLNVQILDPNPRPKGRVIVDVRPLCRR